MSVNMSVFLHISHLHALLLVFSTATLERIKGMILMVRSSLARSKSGLTSSSVPIGLPLPNVQLALEKVRCVIEEESE